MRAAPRPRGAAFISDLAPDATLGQAGQAAPKVTGTAGDWSLRALPSGSLHTQDSDKVQRQTLVDRGAHLGSTPAAPSPGSERGADGAPAWPLSRLSPPLLTLRAVGLGPQLQRPGTCGSARLQPPPPRALSSPALQPQVWVSQPLDLEEHPGGGHRKGKAQLSAVIPSEDAGSDNHPGARRKRSTK